MKIIFIRLFLVVLSTIFTVLFCQWISEKFFFDKFYYYKSIAHGYTIPGKKLVWQDYGKRAQDLIYLTSHKNQNEKVLGINNTNKTFTVAVIGDSFVWGQGLRENDRFVNILEKKLNTTFPSKVISLGNNGDRIVDNYIKYKLTDSLNPPVDLYIFGMVDNDLIFSYGNNPNYDKTLNNEILNKCPQPFIYTPLFRTDSDWNYLYKQALIKSYDNKYGNFCILRYIAPLLPKNNAIYYSYYPLNDKYLIKISETLKENNLTVIYPTQGYISKYIKKQSDWYVSEKEKHPSKKANQMFAEQLFDYIIENKYIPK